MSRRLLHAAVATAAFAFLLTYVPPAPHASWVARAQTADLPALALGSPLKGFTSPVGVAHAGDGSNRLFVVEQGGRVRVVKGGVLRPAPFLDISSRVSTGGERGLLGLAFPPAFATRQRFYVYYPNRAGDIVISRFRVSAGDADVADPDSEQVVITVPHPGQTNHNGGQLAFGPQDGFLYAGTGDGGSAGDPLNNAQNTNVLLGKLLRLDVETGDPATYKVPSSNPFVGRTGFRPEIWAYGLRNPWRFSFDRQTKDLYVADVGQGSFEEVDLQPAASAGGENYGWRVTEGTHCFNPNPCSTAGLTPPVVEYDHSAGDCSVTGGYVYRGTTYTRMQGLYIYGDYCSGRIWGLRHVSGAWQSTLLLDTRFNLTAFGEDEAGNLYAASYGTGEIYPLVDAPPSVSINDVSVKEGDGGRAGVAFTVTLSRPPDSAVSVSYHTSDGTAAAPGDYQPASGSVTFNPGQTTAAVVVQVVGDAVDEPDETFDVTLDAVTGPATLADARGVGTIMDDDSAPTPTGTPEIKFGSTSFVIPEQSGPAVITVLRSGDPSVELSVEYATSDGTALSRSDFTAARGTLSFAAGETQKTFLVLLTNDDTSEGDEALTVTLGNLAGAGSLEASPARTLTIVDDDATTGATNPADRSDFFVRQHYHDFLNREPDDAGLDFWTGGIEICHGDAGCREAKRIDTSAAFFLSIEFQETGYLAYRVHKTAFGTLPGKPVPITFDDFIEDAHELGSGVVVNVGDWRARLEANKRSYAEGFVRRDDFLARYPASLTAAQYVAALNSNAGSALTPAEESELAARLADGRETRAGALLQIAEDEDLRNAEKNPAFVLMEYFGYLRRNPDEAGFDGKADPGFVGYNFWLKKLNDFGGDFHAAEMVKAFIESIEYRQRFKP